MRVNRIFFLSCVLILLVCSAFGADFNSELEKAKRGNAEAQFQVGWMYDHGRGVKQDYKKAREWYEKAANQGHAVAQNNLGVLYVNGYGGPQDYKKAREWAEKSAAQGHAEAQYGLGTLYHNGLGVKQDYKKARYWYEKAAAQGHAWAQNNLGLLYVNGYGGPQDYRRAFEYFTRGAGLGNSDSMTWLGWMYAQGKGVNVDYKKAREWYEKAAAKGNETAKNNLANLAKLEASQTTTAKQKPSTRKVAKDNPDTKKQPKPQIPASTPKVANNDNITPKQSTATIFTNTDSRAKPRLAVRTFDDKCDVGKKPASAITDLMIDELGIANLFSLIEREHFDDYLGNEVNIGPSGLIDPSTAPTPGKMKGIQYHMIGSIMFCQYYEKGSGVVIPLLGIATKSKTAYVVIHIRIVDSSTGEIVYTARQTGSYKQTSKGASANYGGFFIGSYSRKTGGLLEQAALDAVQKHVSAIRSLNFHL